MRDVFWGMTDGDTVGCVVRCGYGCMRIPVQRSALEQRSECVGRGAKYQKDRVHGEFVEKQEESA